MASKAFMVSLKQGLAAVRVQARGKQDARFEQELVKAAPTVTKAAALPAKLLSPPAKR